MGRWDVGGDKDSGRLDSVGAADLTQERNPARDSTTTHNSSLHFLPIPPIFNFCSSSSLLNTPSQAQITEKNELLAADIYHSTLVEGRVYGRYVKRKLLAFGF